MKQNKEAQQHLRSDRKYLRTRAEIPCEVGLAGGGMNAALIHDLSCGGVKFSCNQHTVDIIFPDDQAPLGVVLDAYIEIHFRLYTEDKRAASIMTSARIIHTERLAQDLYQVGVQFIGLKQVEMKRLETFILASRQE